MQGLFQTLLPAGLLLQRFFGCQALGLRPLQLFGTREGGVVFRNAAVEARQRVSDLVQALGIPRVSLLEQGERLFHRELSLGGLLQPGSIAVALGSGNAAQVLGDALPQFPAYAVGRSSLFLQLFLKDPIGAGMEKVAENRLAVFRVGQEQLQKVALGDHGDLGKLVSVQTEQGLYLLGDILRPGHGPAVREQERRIRRLLRKPAAAPGRPFVFRVSAHGIALAGMREDQLDPGGRLGGGILRAQHGRLAAASAGLTVEGKGDGVKKARLPGAGVAGDQVQAALAEAFEIHGGLARIRAEGGQGQFQRSHTRPSQMLSISPAEKRACSSDRGMPFCFS